MLCFGLVFIPWLFSNVFFKYKNSDLRNIRTLCICTNISTDKTTLDLHTVYQRLVRCSGGGLVAYAEANPSNGAYIASSEAVNEKKKVVVLGTGWAGTSFMKNLNNPKYEVQVISPRNYFAFTPLLPSVTCGTVEARSVVEPVRSIFRKVIKNASWIETTEIMLLYYVLVNC